MNIQLNSLSVAQLQRAITIKEQIEALNAELASLFGAAPVAAPKAPVASSTPAPLAKKKKVMSPAARAKISAALKARWAEKKGVPVKAPQTAKPVQTSKPKPKMSAQGRANIIAAQKARWAKVKAAKPQAAATKPEKKVVRNISAEARRKMAEAAKARWARGKAAKK